MKKGITNESHGFEGWFLELSRLATKQGEDIMEYLNRIQHFLAMYNRGLTPDQALAHEMKEDV